MARTNVKTESVQKPMIWWENALPFTTVHIAAVFTVIYLPYTFRTAVLVFANWQIAMLGITIGYHRLWSHRSFTARLPLRVVLMLAGTLGSQGSIRWWAIRHRLHHRFTDTDSDPYSAKRGLLFSHVGWIFFRQRYPKLALVQKKDLDSDPVVAFQHRHYVAMTIVLCAFLPSIISRFWMADSLAGFLYGGVVARVLIWHCVFLINSLAHYLGDQEYTTEVTARGNLLLAMLTCGEGNHNFHHAFPADYRNGFKATDWDPSKWLIHLFYRFSRQVPSVRYTSDKDVDKARGRVWKELHGRVEEMEEYTLPTVRSSDICQTYAGKPVIVVGGYALDVRDFDHSGGSSLLRQGYGGKDLTAAFATLNTHSRQAHDLMRNLKIAKVVELEEDTASPYRVQVGA